MIGAIILAIVVVGIIVCIEIRLPRPQRSAAFFLLVATAGYLAFELAFNARLLDVAGRPGVADAIAGIEQWGRIISGFAVALAFWGLLAQFAAKEDWDGFRLTTAMFVSAAIIVPIVYLAEEALMTSGANQATLQERQVASLSVVVTRYLRQNRNLEGLPLTSEVLVSPEGKAFYALFPSIYGAVLSNVSDARSITEPAIRDAVRREFGTPEITYRDAYQAAVRESQRIYNEQYVPAARTYADTFYRAPTRARQAWQSYVEQLAQRNWTPNGVPSSAHNETRRRVQDDLEIPVPNNWPVWDRFAFEKAVQNKIQSAARSEWALRSGEVLNGAVLSPDIKTFSEFMALTPLQNRLRQNVILARCRAGPITNRLSLAEWDRRCHGPALRSATDEFISALTGDASAFREGGRNYCLGVSAVHSQQVPWSALTISLAGAFYHSSKVVWYICYLVPGLGAWFLRWPIRIGFIAIMAMAPRTLDQDFRIVDSSAYAALMLHKEHVDGGLRASMFDWVIRAEVLYYPTSDRLRRRALGNFRFQPPFAMRAECEDPKGLIEAVAAAATVPQQPESELSASPMRTSWLSGRWNGAHQPQGAGAQQINADFTVDQDGRLRASIVYPDVSCSGYWVTPDETWTDEGAVLLRESIDAGSCLQGGFIQLWRADNNQVQYWWRTGVMGEILSHGSLRRQ